MTKINPYWYLPAGILLLASTHLSHGINLTAWIAYTPFLIYLSKTRDLKSRLIFLLALIIGWSLATAKIITPPLKFYFVFMYSIPIALFHLPGFILWNRLKNKVTGFLVFPASMVVLEWVQYTFTPLASWGVAAYTQSGSLIMMQSLSLFGLAGLSFMIYWVNISAAYLYLNRKTGIVTIGLPAFVLVALLIFGSVRINTYNSVGKKTTMVAAVGTDSESGGLPLPTEEVNSRVRKSLFERTVIAANSGAKLIVWNEASTIILPGDEDLWQKSLSELASRNIITLCASYVVPVSLEPVKYRNKYLFIDSNGKILYEYDKHEPVPGEPAFKGKQAFKVYDSMNSKTGGAICYDYDFPYIAKKYGKLMADIVALPSSDWRGIDPIHTEMAAFRAVEQGHSIVRSTRFGLSAAINPVGDMVAKMSSYDENTKIMTASLPVKGTRTLYSIIDDTFIYLCLTYITILLILKKQ